jgi:signal transduction histidine kinase
LAQETSALANLRPKRVLLLFGEVMSLPGNVMFEQAVRAELQKSVTNRIEFFTEDLDSARFPDEEQFRVFRNYLNSRYARKRKPDLIIAFMGRNFNLATDLRRTIFPDEPFLFVAATEAAIPSDLTELGLTGIVQRLDTIGTLTMMLRLQPETRRVVIIGGVSEPDRLFLRSIEEAARAFDRLSFDFWTNRPIAELPAAAASLPENTAILLSSVRQDVTGQAFYMVQAEQMLAPVSRAPIYTFGGGLIGGGAVGGSVIDTEVLGTRIAQMGRPALKGQPVTNQPVEIRTNGTSMVDWRALKRWQISESRLPPHCVVRYRPASIWEQHRNLILTALGVFFAQGITIAALLAQRARRRWAEGEIQRQRAELAHATRVSTAGQLASALAHELNQPLGAILRNAEAAEIFLQGPNPDLTELRAILVDIRKDDQRAGGVIDRLRSLLKRRNLEHEEINLGELLQETVKLVEPEAAARRIKVALDLPTRLPAIKGDRVQLQQVALNLILNGMDATETREPPARQVTIRAREAPEGAEVAVLDRGAGIPAEKLPRLFEPFFTTKPNGMGMGLAISRTIIETHGGKLRGENNADGGATFRFTLPANGA